MKKHIILFCAALFVFAGPSAFGMKRKREFFDGGDKRRKKITRVCEKYRQLDGSLKCPKCKEKLERSLDEAEDKEICRKFSKHVSICKGEKRGRSSSGGKKEYLDCKQEDGSWKCPKCPRTLKVSYKKFARHACYCKGTGRFSSGGKKKYLDCKQEDGSWKCPKCPRILETDYKTFAIHVCNCNRKKKKKLPVASTRTNMKIDIERVAGWSSDLVNSVSSSFNPVENSIAPNNQLVPNGVLEKRLNGSVCSSFPYGVIVEFTGKNGAVKRSVTKKVIKRDVKNRSIDVSVKIVPSLPSPDQKIGINPWIAFFNGICFLNNNNFSLMKDHNKFEKSYSLWSQELVSFTSNPADVFHKLVFKGNNDVKLLGNGYGGVRKNVSIIKDLREVERAFVDAYQELYRMSLGDRRKLDNEISMLSCGEFPEYLKLVDRKEIWNYSSHLLQNIRRFRKQGDPQIVLVDIGEDYWITIKIMKQEDKVVVIVADSLYRNAKDYTEKLSRIITRICSIFCAYDLPNPMDVLSELY